MKNLLKSLWGAELLLALLIILGVADANLAYISLFVLLLGVWKLSDLDALRLYILSIPIFVALPSSSLSDSMSVWRFAILFLVLKLVEERFGLLSLIRDRTLLLADKRQELGNRIGEFAAGVRSSNYYSLLLPVLLLLAVSLLSLIGAQSLGAGLKKIIFLGSVFSLFALVYSAARKKEEAVLLLRAIFLSCTGILAVGYLQLTSTFFINLFDFWGLWNNHVIQAFYGERMMVLLSYSNTWFSYYDTQGIIPPTLRMFSVMPDSHSFSMVMLMLSPLAIFFSVSAKEKRARRAYFSVFLLALLAVFFSGSRGAWVGYLGALLGAGFFYVAPRLRRKLEISGDKRMHRTLLLAVLSFVLLFPVSSFVLGINQDMQLYRAGKAINGERNNSMLERTWSISNMEETSNKGRMEIWRDSLISIEHHPLLGIGLGNFPLALSEKLSSAKMGASAHNIYLDVAVELGIAGLIVFLLIHLRIMEKLLLLAGKFREEKLRYLAFSFLIFSLWMFTYGFFDVVILNDKVLSIFVAILAVIYRLEDLEEKEIVAGEA